MLGADDQIVVHISERRDWSQSELGPLCVQAVEARRKHLDEGATAEDRVRQVEERRRGQARSLSHVQRTEQHAVDHHHVGRFAVQLGRHVASDRGAEAQLVDQEFDLCSEVVRVVHLVPVVGLRKRREPSTNFGGATADRAVSKDADVVSGLDEVAGNAERRHEVPRPVPRDDQVAGHDFLRPSCT